MNIYSFSNPRKVAQHLALRLRGLRLARGWKQSTLAERSGVTLPSLRRFETKGEISLAGFLKLAFALDGLEEVEGLFKDPPAASLRELEARESSSKRRRGFK